MDSVELLTLGDNTWKIIESLKFPKPLMSPSMIKVQNAVFITGKVTNTSMEFRLRK